MTLWLNAVWLALNWFPLFQTKLCDSTGSYSIHLYIYSGSIQLPCLCVYQHTHRCPPCGGVSCLETINPPSWYVCATGTCTKSVSELVITPLTRRHPIWSTPLLYLCLSLPFWCAHRWMALRSMIPKRPCCSFWSKTKTSPSLWLGR